jgi:soluble lytic murein transglycosylase
MQVMPSNARNLSRVAGVPYRPEALLSDASYNMQLGMAEFAGHLSRYGGSLVLALAAYNAGPTNAARWVRTNGDPRLPGVDPIDWIERISFPETRNYVSRVLENLGVYRARLAGMDVPVTILDDLYAPNAPPSATGP